MRANAALLFALVAAAVRTTDGVVADRVEHCDNMGNESPFICELFAHPTSEFLSLLFFPSFLPFLHVHFCQCDHCCLLLSVDTYSRAREIRGKQLTYYFPFLRCVCQWNGA